MSLADFKDEKGFIGHKNPFGDWDFGDSAQRTFTELLCREPNYNEFKYKIIDITHTEQFVRHWDHRMWWGQLWTMSRDNFKPVMWASAYNKQTFEIQRIKERKFIAWNWKRIWPNSYDEPKIPDFFLPTIVWGAEIRARRASRFGDLILLSLCDVVDLLSTCALFIKSWFKPNETSSDLNQINEIIFKCKTVGTPFSWVARKFYRWFRRGPTIRGAYPDHPEYSVTGKHKIKDVLRVYYNTPKQHPPMWEVLDPMIDKYIS